MYALIGDEVVEVEVQDFGNLKYLREATFNTNHGREWIVFQDRDEAGEAAREHWEDMAHNDKSEFVCMVGEEALIDWALGNWAHNARNLEEWLDNWRSIPEEQWASYDGHELEGTVSKGIQEELDFSDKHVIFYRHN